MTGFQKVKGHNNLQPISSLAFLSNPYKNEETDQRKTQEKFRSIRYAVIVMAGIPGKSGPPGNQNAFRHGLAGISQRRTNGALKPAEHSVREEILAGLLADKGEDAQISTAMRACWPRSSRVMCRYW
jgi:hypothetical protein